MQEISEKIAAILENSGYTIIFNGEVEGFLSERWEIKFSEKFQRFTIQIFEASIKYPGNVQLDYVPSSFETLFTMLKIGLKDTYTLMKNGTSNGQDLYLKVQEKSRFFDVYIDPK